jgi:hypothetical protein
MRAEESSAASALREEEEEEEDAAFVAKEDVVEKGDARVGKQVARKPDAYEAEHLPERVLQWIREGNLTHDVYHDGAHLRFRWTDKVCCSFWFSSSCFISCRRRGRCCAVWARRSRWTRS